MQKENEKGGKQRKQKICKIKEKKEENIRKNG